MRLEDSYGVTERSTNETGELQKHVALCKDYPKGDQASIELRYRYQDK